MENSEIIQSIAKTVLHHNSRIKAIMDHAVEQEARFLALGIILERKGILTFEELDKEQEKAKKQVIKIVEDMLQKETK
ncbi:hypothetical protein [Paenibacillus sp.]|uniref:hypothetical protein n=1 Tax=Paenibacillus sp. TaxID=58172 RepID=UPI003561D580